MCCSVQSRVEYAYSVCTNVICLSAILSILVFSVRSNALSDRLLSRMTEGRLFRTINTHTVQDGAENKVEHFILILCTAYNKHMYAKS